MRYDPEMLKQINDGVDLLAYAEKSFELRQNGNNYFTNCPLHEDKTPSLSFNSEKNMYYCFSCGKSGGIIKYLMDFEGLKFQDAVDKAAGLAKVDIGSMCKSETISFLRELKHMKTCGRMKKSQPHAVLQSSEWSKYKKCRIPEWLDEGISQNTMDTFDIRIDEYGNRIVYPVYDNNGRLINIKGRTRYKNYKELQLPKYINYFTVGTVDYFQGLNKTLPFVKERNELIVFESIKSVMKAYDWGYKNCASSEKHTLTPEQIEIIVRLRCDVVFAYDSDISYISGQVKRDIDKLSKVTNVYVITDPNNLLGGEQAKNSPADCGREIWEELYSNKQKVVW